MRRCISLVALVALLAGMAGTPTAAVAAGKAGIEGGYGGDFDWYLGLRAEGAESELFGGSRAVVTFDWYFPETDKSRYYEFNLNYLFPLSNMTQRVSTNLYLGAGLNIGRRWVADVQDSQNWGFGMNVLGGLEFDLRGRSAFFEGGYNLFSEHAQWHIGVGFLM